MDSKRSHFRTLIGLGAAAGAFGVAAMMSAATAPTARADFNYTEILYFINEDFSFGQPQFATALADFGGGDVSGGLAAFFSGVDDDVLGPSYPIIVGTVDALTNQPLGAGSVEWFIQPEADLAQGTADAQYFFNLGLGFFDDAASSLSSGDYGAATYSDLLGFDYTTIIPLEALILGAVGSLS